jgi:hypothetical protein
MFRPGISPMTKVFFGVAGLGGDVVSRPHPAIAVRPISNRRTADLPMFIGGPPQDGARI